MNIFAKSIRITDLQNIQKSRYPLLILCRIPDVDVSRGSLPLKSLSVSKSHPAKTMLDKNRKKKKRT